MGAEVRRPRVEVGSHDHGEGREGEGHKSRGWTTESEGREAGEGHRSRGPRDTKAGEEGEGGRGVTEEGVPWNVPRPQRGRGGTSKVEGEGARGWGSHLGAT